MAEKGEEDEMSGDKIKEGERVGGREEGKEKGMKGEGGRKGGREEERGTPTSLGVPELDVAVVAAAEELSAISVETNVSHCLSVA